MSKLVDLTGQRFGRLTVTERAQNKGRMTAWLCQCDCGNTIVVNGNNLKNGSTKSCGCYRKEYGRKSLTGNNHQKTHGLCHTRLYRIWGHMKERCCNPDSPKYYRYGARGIKVCAEWMNDFEAFHAWAITHGYAENLSINRIDNDGDYCPENCEWATNEEQANNTSRNHMITYNGETHTIAEWARIKHIPYKTLFKRISDDWSYAKAFETTHK